MKLGPIDFFGFGDAIPNKLYSKSFLGNGAEQTLLAAHKKMELCTTSSAEKRAYCIEKAILGAVFEGNSLDQTLARSGWFSKNRRSYKKQWNLISKEMEEDFYGDYDGENHAFVVSSPSVMGGLQKFFKYQQCTQDKCAILFTSVEDFEDAAQIVFEKFASSIKTVHEKLDIVINDKTRLDEQYQNSYLAIVAQLKAIFKKLHYKKRVLVYNFGSWTDGAVFLMENGLISGDFDPYVIMNTNEKEDKDLVIKTDQSKRK